MKKICHNSIATIYENDNNWIVENDEQEKRIISKDEEPLFPLAAVIKWGMFADDIETLDKLRELAMREKED